MMARHRMLAWQRVVCQGIRTSIAKTNYFFMIFQRGGGQDPLSPSGFMLLVSADKYIQHAVLLMMNPYLC